MPLSLQTDGEFVRLAACARRCALCDSMEGRRRVLSQHNGSTAATVMLVGEAPGRLGAERTGRPFDGDEAGRRLDRLLEAASWRRSDVFLTNAVLCNPRDVLGRNRPPSSSEVRNCEIWLRAQIDVVDPRLVVALGAVALRALRAIEWHDLTLANANDLPVAWRGRFLAARYHPGVRAALHRPIEQQTLDFQQLGEWRRQLSAGSVASR